MSIRAGGDPISLDPSVSYNIGDGPLVALVNPSFYRYKFLKRDPYQLELNLGAALPTVERLKAVKKGDAVERWTYRLRPGIRFGDDPCFPGGKGREVKAADVVYSFKRMADQSVQSPIASYLADKIVGWNADAKAFDTLKKKAYDRELTGVRVDPKDPYAFQIDLDQPYPQLRFLMAMAFTTPQAREAVDRYGDQYALHHPVGCGPFMLKEYVPHDHLAFVRNPNAPREAYPTEADPSLKDLLGDAGKPVPFIDELYLPIMTEAVTSYNLFQQGYLDSLGISGANAQIVPAANGLTQEMKDRGIRLNKNVEVNINYLAFNMDDPIFGGYTPEKRKLRQAISLAIDADTYISIVEQGMALPAEWLIPPGLAGYDANYKNPYRRFTPDLAQAKRLLAEAGYPSGVSAATGQRLALTFDNSAVTASSRAQIRLYQKMIEALGIQVVLNSTEASTYADRINKKQIQFITYGWYADYPDPENFAFLLYGPNESPGPNASLYNNPEYNALFERMRAMNDGPERNAIIAKMRALSVEDCPVIYVDHSVTRTLVQPWVRNQDYSPLASDQIKYVDVDPTMRVRLQRQWNHATLWPLGALAVLVVLVCVPASTTIKNRTNRRVRKRDA